MPNTANQTTHELLDNELKKIYGRFDSIDEKINTLQYGVNLIIGIIKSIQNSSELENSSFAKDIYNIYNSCLTDEQLDAIEKKEMEDYLKT